MECTLIFPLQSNLFRRDEFVIPEKFFDLQRFDDGGEKTEEPTDKKRSDARNKGQVAKSQELNATFVLLGGFLGLRVLWEYIYGNIAGYATYVFSNLGDITTTEGVSEIFLGVMLLLGKTSLPIMLGIMACGLAVNFYQVGFKITTEPIGFKLDKLNPINRENIQF